MRNLSLILNVILVIAVAVLYYLHFNANSTQNELAPGSGSHVVVPHSGILFVNSDSLLDQYEFYKSKKKEFEAEQNRIKNELRNQSDKLQQDVEKYQQEAIGMTDLQRAQREEQLGMRQQQLMQKKDEMLDKLDETQAKSSEELYTRLSDYLKKNRKGNYNYVLGVQKGGGVLYANDSLDITKEVVEGLNKEFLGK